MSRHSSADKKRFAATCREDVRQGKKPRRAQGQNETAREEQNKGQDKEQDGKLRTECKLLPPEAVADGVVSC